MRKFLLAAAIALAPIPAIAADATLGSLKIENPWARATAASARNGGAFLAISNTGAQADKLVNASSTVAARTELHTTIDDNGVMKMRHVPAIEVPAGGMAMLKPGGFHVMLMDLKAPLTEGQTFPLTLTFERAGNVTVDVTVGKPGAMGGMGGHGHQQ